MAYSRTLNHFTSMQELATLWASSTSYVVNQLVINSDKLYRCLIAHTSTASFATDLGAGNWVEVSASASGVKNYITNGNFENSSTSGWNLARSTLNATTKLPNQASGSWTAAAGTLSRTIVTSGQLSGVASLSLASSAATTAGDMLVTDALTLDLEAQASVQTFSFYYRVTSGASNGNFSGTSSNSIGVAIYVVDGALAGTWIQPAGVWSVNTASSVTAITAKAAGTFQVPSDATQVRLAVYFPNASTGAITVYLDDFVLGPQVVQYGAPVTDWQSYTPTFTGFGTVATQTFWWRREGDSVLIKGRFTSGTSTAVEARISLPSGFTSDSTKVNGTIEVAGFFQSGDTGGVTQGVGASISVLVEPSVNYVTFSTRNSGNSGLTKLTGTNVAVNGVSYSFTAQVPILGWSSSVQMSNDTDTRIVDFAGYVTSNTALTANVTPVPLTAVKDSHGAWSTNQYTIPVSGDYQISCVLQASANTTNSIFAYVDGSLRALVSRFNGNTISTGSTLITGLNAGSVITFRTDLGITVQAGSGTGYLVGINRLSGPSAIAASESVTARYTNTAGTALTTSATAANIPFATRTYDSHGSFSGTIFTVPVSGKYRISSNLITQAVTLATTNEFRIVAIKNGNQVSKSFINGNGASNAQNVMVCSTIDCVAGDTLEIRSRISAAASLSTTADDNWICIERVGN